MPRPEPIIYDETVKPSEIFDHAMQLVCAGWTQGEMIERGTSFDIPRPDNPWGDSYLTSRRFAAADRYCIAGALIAAQHHLRCSPECTGEVRRQVEVFEKGKLNGRTVIEYNDGRGRRWEDVVGLLEEMVGYAKGRERETRKPKPEPKAEATITVERSERETSREFLDKEEATA